MKRYILATVVAAASGVFAISGAERTRVVTVPGTITEIVASVGVHVVYIPSATQSVVVDAPDDIMDNIKVSFSNGTLKTEYDYKDDSGMRVNNRSKEFTVTVKGRNVTDFKTSVGASITVDGRIDAAGKSLEFEASVGSYISCTGITADEIEVESTTGSSVELRDISVSSIDAESSVGSSITLTGTAGYADLESVTSSSINAGSLKASSGKAKKDITSSIKSNIGR